MSNHEEHTIKIEPGQVLDPNSFPLPNELVCIQVPKVFDQVALRDCQTTTTTLLTVTGTPPTVTFESAENFDITSVKVLSRNDALGRPGFKKLKIAVTIAFDIFFAINGVTVTTPIRTSTTFNLTINEIYCPSCSTQIGFVRFPESTCTVDVDGTLVKVEAIADAFNDHITITSDGDTFSFSLALDIGVFFLVKCECVVQLLIPAYGYCPVPSEQGNASAKTCCTFNDKRCTPFPTSFYPDQKANILDNDNGKRENWD